MKKKTQLLRYTKEEDEVIQACVEVNYQCVQKGIEEASRLLDRTHDSIQNRYYKMRGKYRYLFAGIDNKDFSYFNLKNKDRFGKFRGDLITSKSKITLRFFNISKRKSQ